MADDPSAKDTLRLGAVLRLMVAAGAADEVLENFVRLHANEASGALKTPYVEIGPAITAAAQAAGVQVANELLAQLGPHLAVAERRISGLVRPQPSSAPSASPLPGAGSARRQSSLTDRAEAHFGERPFIYRLVIGGKRTSLSLPKELILTAAKVLGDEATHVLITESALKTPLRARNRSAHVRATLLAAVDQATRSEHRGTQLQ